LADEELDAPESDSEYVEWPKGSAYLQRAWHVLHDDRFYGAMGGMGRIFYTALSQYARDNGIQLEPFVTFMQAMDAVYLEYMAEKAKIAAANKPS
jgi:hypothetical protein